MSSSVRIVDMPDLGVVTDNSSVVGEHAGSGRFTLPALRNYMMGSGTPLTGPVSVYTTDWLSPLVSWPAWPNSHMYVLSPDGCMAITGASSTLQPSTRKLAIGVSGFGFNNNPADPTNTFAWGSYFEARQYPGAGLAVGSEIEVANVSGVDAGQATPYDMPQPATVGLEVASGAGVTETTPALTSHVASAGIFIQSNTSPFTAGIVISSSAISGTNGLGTGTGIAMSMACGHVVQWYKPDHTAGPAILSTQTTGTPLGILFVDNGMFIGQPTVEYLALLTTPLSLGNTVMQLRVYNNSGATNAPVTIGAPDSGGTGYRVLRVPN